MSNLISTLKKSFEPFGKVRILGVVMNDNFAKITILGFREKWVAAN